MSEAGRGEKVPAAAGKGELEVPDRKPPLLLRALVAGTLTGMGLIAFVYLTMPNLGVVELIPDATPFIGNMDEVGATAVLLMVLSYWGFDVTRLGAVLGNWSAGRKALPPGRGPGGGGKA